MTIYPFMYYIPNSPAQSPFLQKFQATVQNGQTSLCRMCKFSFSLCQKQARIQRFPRSFISSSQQSPKEVKEWALKKPAKGKQISRLAAYSFFKSAWLSFLHHVYLQTPKASSVKDLRELLSKKPWATSQVFRLGKHGWATAWSRAGHFIF